MACRSDTAHLFHEIIRADLTFTFLLKFCKNLHRGQRSGSDHHSENYKVLNLLEFYQKILKNHQSNNILIIINLYYY